LALTLQQDSAPLTIYFGGGTPSILSTRQMARLCKMVRRRWAHGVPLEWTVEANPGTLPPDKLRVLREAGVNRISLGAQSFDDRVLQSLGRRHTAADIVRTLDAVRATGIDNIGIDLIACLPGVTDEQWRITLQRAAALGSAHLSVYALSLDRGSEFSRRATAGTLAEPTETAQLKALRTAATVLKSAGYYRYEISNFARRGSACQHNLAFWRGGDYLGFGPAAASRSGRSRWANRADLAAYHEALQAGRRPPRSRETLTAWQDASERLAFAFRLTEGIDLAAFCVAHGINDQPLVARWRDALASLADSGLVRHCRDRWRLTSRGRDLADRVASELLAPQ
jgi:oxygen-independent coproporphyrinogen-3 oxidase